MTPTDERTWWRRRLWAQRAEGQPRAKLRWECSGAWRGSKHACGRRGQKVSLAQSCVAGSAVLQASHSGRLAFGLQAPLQRSCYTVVSRLLLPFMSNMIEFRISIDQVSSIDIFGISDVLDGCASSDISPYPACSDSAGAEERLPRERSSSRSLGKPLSFTVQP